ncbi:MAG: hypothetical protein HW409_1174 [candidate division NC10 bacterium]|nr:hypothetical protein [candidate division NC10 bacterium]
MPLASDRTFTKLSASHLDIHVMVAYTTKGI